MDFSQLMGLASGHVEARIVQTAVELEIFDATRSADHFPRRRWRRHFNSMSRQQNCCSMRSPPSVCSKNMADQFSLTELSRRYLLRNSPHYVGAMIGFDAMLWRAWERLPEAIRTGLPTRPPNMYQADPRETEVFINAMDSLVKARGDTEVLANAIDWSKIEHAARCRLRTRHLSDCAVRTIFPATRGDRRSAGDFENNRTVCRERQSRRAYRTDPGDYRSDPIPGTYDAIFLSNIIHGENDGRNAALMRKLAANLNPRGRLIVKDHILDDSRAEPAVGAIFSLLMLLTTDGGRCYSFAEIEAWMKQAGLNRVEQIDLPAPLTSSFVIASE